MYYLPSNFRYSYHRTSMMKAAAVWIAGLHHHHKCSHYILSFMLQGLIGISVVVTTCVSAKSIIHFKAIMVADALLHDLLCCRYCLFDQSAFSLPVVIMQMLLLCKSLEFFRDKLLQINWRNRSIMLRRLYDKWSFDLSKLTLYEIKKLATKLLNPH